MGNTAKHGKIRGEFPAGRAAKSASHLVGRALLETFLGLTTPTVDMGMYQIAICSTMNNSFTSYFWVH